MLVNWKLTSVGCNETTLFSWDLVLPLAEINGRNRTTQVIKTLDSLFLLIKESHGTYSISSFVYKFLTCLLAFYMFYSYWNTEPSCLYMIYQQLDYFSFIILFYYYDIGSLYHASLGYFVPFSSRFLTILSYFCLSWFVIIICVLCIELL